MSKNKKKFILGCSIAIVAIILACALVMVASYIEMNVIYRVIIIVLSFIVAVVGIMIAAKIEREVGCFECPKCNERFMPTVKQYLKSYHTLTRRNLTCPKCGDKSMCRYRIK